MTNIIPMEIRRAHNQLTAYCNDRNQSNDRGQGKLECILDGSDLVIMQVLSDARQPLVKCNYSAPVWYLFLSKGVSEWQEYPHLPEAASVQEIIRELEQAPLHVHW